MVDSVESQVRNMEDFAEIPRHVLDQYDQTIDREALEVLYAEAVARGDLPAAPNMMFEGTAGRVLRLVFSVALGAVVGMIAVVMILYLFRSLSTLF
ncbi:MAG: hypothetical protein DWQ01_15205 [Planctomycetota bacterium]|nr:MAG: hypothetical protein DWQ01_15205 [Planctomycetota bacterium]